MPVVTRLQAKLMREGDVTINMTESQLQQLLGAIATAARPAPAPSQPGSFEKATFAYHGERDPTCVQTFLTAASCFKRVGNITDDDALRSLPLILKDAAAVWWNGVGRSIRTWSDFESRLRRAFAPRKPAYILYKEICLMEQGPRELTETFVAKQRDLIAQLPEPHPLEKQQLDMVYGTLHKRIKEKIPRETALTFDVLLEAARSVEELLDDEPSPPPTPTVKPKERIRCSYCRVVGHTEDMCRKKVREAAAREAAREAAKIKALSLATTSAAATTQAPSPSRPIFECYGCGTPGVVRSRCPKCAENKKPIKTERVDFCATGINEDTAMDIRTRPVIGIGIDTITGSAFIDTCAKSNVASFELYTCLKMRGYRFTTEYARVTLADGVEKLQEVLKVKCVVNVCDRAVTTKFIVFPGKRDTRTLLGVPFLQDAGIIINMPQMTWHFIDNPYTVYELGEEDASGKSVTYVSDSSMGPAIAASAVMQNTTELDARRSTLQRALPFDGDGDLLSESATFPYKLNPLTFTDLPNNPPHKRTKPLFDGYSPRFVDDMYEDAQQTLLASEVELSPHAEGLFPEPSRTGMNLLEIKAAQSSLLNYSQNGLYKEHGFQVSEPCFSAWAAPVVMAPKEVWQWGTEQEESFCTLRTCLTAAPVLKQTDESKPNINKPHAVLVQGEGQDAHPLQYASRLLKPLPGKTGVSADTLSRPFCHQEDTEKGKIYLKSVTDSSTWSLAVLRQRQNKEIADRNRSEAPTYERNDLVLVTTHTLSNAAKGVSAKFAPRRDGPYLIKERIGTSTYILAPLGKPDETVGIYHAKDLSPYRSDDVNLPTPVQPLRKRGRPRKAVPVHNAEATTRRRGRGRPKKPTQDQ